MLSRAAKSLRPKVLKAFKRIDFLVKEYGKVRITFQNYYHIGGMFSEEKRKRILDKDGYCKVSYLRVESNTWSGYSKSCFLSERRDDTLKQTLKAMMNHDGSRILPIKIEYGLFYRHSEDL